MKYSAEIKVTNEVLEHDNLKKLYHLVLEYGMELIREYGYISKYADRIVIYNNETYEQICSIHFGQTINERGTNFSSVRVRSYHGRNNKDKFHYYKVRKYNIDKYTF